MLYKNVCWIFFSFVLTFVNFQGTKVRCPIDINYFCQEPTRWLIFGQLCVLFERECFALSKRLLHLLFRQIFINF